MTKQATRQLDFRVRRIGIIYVGLSLSLCACNVFACVQDAAQALAFMHVRLEAFLGCRVKECSYRILTPEIHEGQQAQCADREGCSVPCRGWPFFHAALWFVLGVNPRFLVRVRILPSSPGPLLFVKPWACRL